MGNLIRYALIKDNQRPKDNPAWCMLLSTQQEIDLVSDGLERQRTHNMLHGKGGYEKHQISIDDFCRFEAQVRHKWAEYVDEGVTIVKWLANTGYTVLTKSWNVIELIELPYPEQPGENYKAHIVVCENDAQPEAWWIQNLRDTFSDKTITTLTNFSLRSKESLSERFKAASIISFTTTFTDWDWFEKVLDVVIENNLTGKFIYGNHVDATTDYPVYISAKIKQVIEIGNSIQIQNGQTNSFNLILTA